MVMFPTDISVYFRRIMSANQICMYETKVWSNGGELYDDIA